MEWFDTIINVCKLRDTSGARVPYLVVRIAAYVSSIFGEIVALVVRSASCMVGRSQHTSSPLTCGGPFARGLCKSNGSHMSAHTCSPRDVCKFNIR